MLLSKISTITILCCAFCSFSLCLQAQTYQFSGRIIDDDTQEPIPFANIYIPNSNTGTVSDFDGLYTLSTNFLPDSIAVSSIGYTIVSKKPSTATDQTINFRLRRDDVMIEEFVVVAGENPADTIVRNIIANKTSHNINNLNNYTYEVYNKLELDISNPSEKMMDRKILKPFAFIFENIDSVSEEKPFLPLFLTETLSDYYYQKQPKIAKEVIKASKISGIENETVSQYLGSMYQQVNIYEDWMPMMGKNVPSPINDQALFYYKFLIVDSAEIDGCYSYKLTFKPKRKQATAFVGDFWVCAEDYAIQQIAMQLVAKEININFIDRISVFQEFTPIVEKVWAITKDKLIVSFTPGKKDNDNMGVIGRKSTSHKNFLVNNDLISNRLTNKIDVEIGEDIFDKSEEFWQQARHDSLSKSEQSIYALVDTIKNMPIAKTYAEIISLIVTGYKTVGPVEVGPYFSLVSFNNIEHWRFRMGFRTNSDFSKRMRLGAYVAYGTNDKRFKYGADLILVVNRKPWQRIDVSFKNDLDIESDNSEDFGQDNIFAGLYRRQIPQKLILQQNFKASYQRDWKMGWSNSIGVNYLRQQPYFDYYFFGDENPPSVDNPASSTISRAEIQLNTRFAYKEKFIAGNYLRASTGSDFPIVNVKYSLGLKGVLGSNYNYHRIDFNIYDWFYVGPIGYLSYIVRGGKIFSNNALPFLLLYDHPGNETFFYNTHSFNWMNDYEFISDTYLNVFLTHHFDGAVFDRLPGIRKLKLRLVATGKIGFGTLSDKHIEAHNDPNNTLFSFAKEHEEFGLAPWVMQTPTLLKPYVEAGIGIENILKFFRIDVIWRPIYSDTPGQPSVRAGMQLLF